MGFLVREEYSEWIVHLGRGSLLLPTEFLLNQGGKHTGDRICCLSLLTRPLNKF